VFGHVRRSIGASPDGQQAERQERRGRCPHHQALSAVCCVCVPSCQGIVVRVLFFERDNGQTAKRPGCYTSFCDYDWLIILSVGKNAKGRPRGEAGRRPCGAAWRVAASANHVSASSRTLAQRSGLPAGYP
jgi:hypothetical protein